LHLEHGFYDQLRLDGVAELLDQIEVESREPRFLRSPVLSQFPGLEYAVTFRGTDMGTTAGRDIEGCRTRRRQVCRALSVPFDRLTAGRQVHGNQVRIVTGELIGSGHHPTKPPIPNTDGLVTDEPNVPLMVLGADCGMVAIYDPVRHAVGLCHAGWRGTAAGIVEALIGSMVDAFGCRATHMVAAISPCARACCYEVGQVVVERIAVRFPDGAAIFDRRGGRTYLDLGGAIARQIRTMGVQPENIGDAAVCTICGTDFYSYRRDGPSTGHFASIASLR